MHLKRLLCAGLLVTGFVGADVAKASADTLSGSGSTFVAPILAEWGSAWGNSTGNTVQYQPVGSGQGIKDISQRLVDFGASDAPLNAAQAGACRGCFQIPWALSADGVGYHLRGVKGLRLTGPIVADIYLGKITKWNSPRIKAVNRGKRLPNLRITPLHRSDGSGTTYAFTDYLSHVSGSFKRRVGRSTSVTWPVGPGAKGNAGVVSLLDTTNGAISYNEVSYLIAHKEPAAAIRNAAGRYLYPNLSNIKAAGRIIKHVPRNNEMHIVNPRRSAKTAYPICTFTYAIVPKDAKQRSLIKKFVRYVIGPGQRFGPALDFAPIPKVVFRAAQSTLNRLG